MYDCGQVPYRLVPGMENLEPTRAHIAERELLTATIDVDKSEDLRNLHHQLRGDAGGCDQRYAYALCSHSEPGGS